MKMAEPGHGDVGPRSEQQSTWPVTLHYSRPSSHEGARVMVACWRVHRWLVLQLSSQPMSPPRTGGTGRRIRKASGLTCSVQWTADHGRLPAVASCLCQSVNIHFTTKPTPSVIHYLAQGISYPPKLITGAYSCMAGLFSFVASVLKMQLKSAYDEVSAIEHNSVPPPSQKSAHQLVTPINSAMKPKKLSHQELEIHIKHLGYKQIGSWTKKMLK